MRGDSALPSVLDCCDEDPKKLDPVPVVSGAAKIGEIDSMFILASYRRQGIGRAKEDLKTARSQIC
jgi:GNAT superfamily N-acetyltransferase